MVIGSLGSAAAPGEERRFDLLRLPWLRWLGAPVPHVELPVLVRELTERHYVEGVSDPDAASEDELRRIVESAEVVQPVSAGSCLFSSSLVLHSTAPNQSQRRRRSAASWYVNANSRYRNPDREVEWPRVR